MIVQTKSQKVILTNEDQKDITKSEIPEKSLEESILHRIKSKMKS